MEKVSLRTLIIRAFADNEGFAHIYPIQNFGRVNFCMKALVKNSVRVKGECFFDLSARFTAELGVWVGCISSRP